MQEEKQKVIGVSFRRAGKVYFFNPASLDLKTGDWVVVETIRGIELGKVSEGPEDIPVSEIKNPVKNIQRKATHEDIDNAESNRIKAAEAYIIARDKIEEHGLPMKLVDVEYTLDESKIVFYFSAEGRIDFRNLVKDLVAILKKRIELHQIGVRDEAKMLGSLGPCGRIVCCASFLREFEPVSIKMAKDQNLSLNPLKISGSCGRLMCCLKYEEDVYQELRKELLAIGSEVELPEGIGHVVELNIPKKTVIVELPSKARVEISGCAAQKQNGGCQSCASHNNQNKK